MKFSDAKCTIAGQEVRGFEPGEVKYRSDFSKRAREWKGRHSDRRMRGMFRAIEGRVSYDNVKWP